MPNSIPVWAHYREAEKAGVTCSTCDFFEASRCSMFEFAKVRADYTCDEWDGAEMTFSAEPNNRGKTPEQNMLESPSPIVRKFDPIITGKSIRPVKIQPLPPKSQQELVRFWRSHPNLRAECLEKYGHDPVENADSYWSYGLAEPEHHDVLAKVQRNSGLFTLPLVKAWEREELAHAKIEKAQTVRLSVRGISKAGAGHVYRMQTRDGKYVGQTKPSTVVAGRGQTLNVSTAGEGWEAVDITPDAPHSWAELEGLAGDTIYSPDVGLPASTQDYSAEGPGGDIPEPGDNMNLSNAALGKEGSGPTSSSVHVNAPLPNISVSYTTVGQKMKRIKPKDVKDEPTVEPMLAVRKADNMKQIVYGVVLEPHFLDSQADYMLPGSVEKAAHTYLKKIVRGKASVSKFQHRRPALFKNKPSVVPVESFIAPQDFKYDGSDDLVKKGSWVLAVHVEDPATWQEVLDGKWAGFSVGGVGVRQSMTAENLLEGNQWMTTQPSTWSPKPPYTG